MPKGMELPLNVIIFVAVALLVLAAIGGFFFGFFNDNSVNNKKLFLEGCASLRAFHECDHREVNSISVEEANFGFVCGRSGFGDTAQCAKACGCYVPDGETGQSLSAVNAGSDSLYIYTRPGSV